MMRNQVIGGISEYRSRIDVIDIQLINLLNERWKQMSTAYTSRHTVCGLAHNFECEGEAMQRIDVNSRSPMIIKETHDSYLCRLEMNKRVWYVDSNQCHICQHQNSSDLRHYGC